MPAGSVDGGAQTAFVAGACVCRVCLGFRFSRSVSTMDFPHTLGLLLSEVWNLTVGRLGIVL